MAAMAVKPPIRQFSACLRCLRTLPAANGTSTRLFSSSATTQDELATKSATPAPPAPLPSNDTTPTPPAPSQPFPEYMKKWGTLDPQTVENKKQERRLIRREHLQPIGSRRRRAVLRRSALQKATEIPFEQLPYQCFQEARKVLLEDRQEKISKIQTQQVRIKNLTQQTLATNGPSSQGIRLKRMRRHLDQLVIEADINDPMVKKKFEDGQADMNKPIYRHLADKKWRAYKRLVLEQRLTQMSVVPDLLQTLNIVADIDLGFGRKPVAPGEFVDSSISEKMPRLNVQTFTPGEKLVTIAIVDADVPVLETDSFTSRCHLIASNILISPTQTSIPLQRIEQEDNKCADASAKKIALPWLAPWAHKGSPYHRLAVIVLEQKETKTLDVVQISKSKRDDFNLRSFIDKQKLSPLTATLFRTQWDESMAGVMERAGLKDQIGVELKRRRVEPLPYKRRTERMR
ncbi:phosphatidylethanolamine-binding protein [Phaeosphaeriaceae sp. PMI808]|nr:phosphatidylethanolamine-binding protein [Phaeosphaeriaceae sp. PMI808]